MTDLERLNEIGRDWVLVPSDEEWLISLARKWIEAKSAEGEIKAALRACECNTFNHRERDHRECLACALATAQAERDRAVAALRFYADRASYRQHSIDEQRARDGGADPTTAIRDGLHRHTAPPGLALSDIQKDNYGDRAREALRSRTTGGADA